MIGGHNRCGCFCVREGRGNKWTKCLSCNSDSYFNDIKQGKKSARQYYPGALPQRLKALASPLQLPWKETYTGTPLLCSPDSWLLLGNCYKSIQVIFIPHDAWFNVILPWKEIDTGTPLLCSPDSWLLRRDYYKRLQVTGCRNKHWISLALTWNKKMSTIIWQLPVLTFFTPYWF